MQQLTMGPSKPRNYNHMEGDSRKKCKSEKTIYGREEEVRCVLEFNDSPPSEHKNFKNMFPTNKLHCPVMRHRLARHLHDCHGKHARTTNFGSTFNLNLFPTDKLHCPVLRQRLTRHLQDCQGNATTTNFGSTFNLDFQALQSKASKPATDRGVLTDFSGKSIILSPTISMVDRISIQNTQSQNKYPANTKPAPNNSVHKPRVENLYVRKKGYNVTAHKGKHNLKQVKPTETVTLHPRGQYKDNLQSAIVQWLTEIPVLSSVNQSSTSVRDNAVNELHEAIYNLSTDINNDSYEDNVKIHIHDFLESLPIWSAYSLHDKRILKADLEENLFDRIKKLNKELFNANNDKKIYVRNSPNRKVDNDYLIEQLVMTHLSNLKFVDTDIWGNPFNIQDVKNLFVQRLKPVINVMPQIEHKKFFLKTEVMNILKDIPLAWPYNTDETLDKCAQELTDSILGVICNECFKQSWSDLFDESIEANIFYNLYSDTEMKKYQVTQNIIQLVNAATDTNNSNKEGLIDVLLNSFDSIISGNDFHAKSEIYEFLISCYDMTDLTASFLTNKIVEKMKNATRTAVMDKSCSPVCFNKSILRKDMIVYVSEHDLYGTKPIYPITSTPKNNVSKLNAEERKYVDDLSELIWTWIDTIPELEHVNKDNNYKEVMVSDLAGHLMHEMKLEQYAPDKRYYGTRDNMIFCAIRSWIIKFEEEAFKSIEDIKPYVDNFIQKFKKIPVPILTKLPHGNRKDIQVAIFRQDLSDTEYISELINKLKDEMSIWLKEQPSHIYLNESRDTKNDLLHDFATKIQDQIKNKRPSEEMKLQIKLWLDNIVKPNEKEKLDDLSESLKDRILKMELSETVKAKQDDDGKLLNKSTGETKHDITTEIDGDNREINLDLNKTIISFIDKFIEHNCEEDDIVIKGAYNELLKSELRRLCPQEVMELRANGETNCTTKDLLQKKLNRELHYIKDISDWLNNIPIDNSFNVPGNKQRIAFIIHLAKDICEVEIRKLQAPEAAKDYEYNLTQLMYSNYLPTIPILSNCKQYQPQIVQQLIDKVVKSRLQLNQPTISENKVISDSSETLEQNLGEFIDEYIRINGKQLGDDPVKLEAWTARLLQEINRIVHEPEETTTLKVKVYNKLAEIPTPGTNSVLEFNRRLMYAHEIGDWIKNMPLQRISDGDTKNMIVKMVSDLAETLSVKQSTNIKNDPELKKIVTQWITTLPLEPAKQIDISVLIQQLSNRIKRVNEGKKKTWNVSTIVYEVNKCLPDLNNSNQKQLISKTHRSKVGSSGELIVEAIENWCNELPVYDDQGSNEYVKDNIKIRLYQKIGDLNLDPKYNDDILYRDQLSDEIDDIFKDMHQYDVVQKRKDTLKSNLIDNIVEARTIIKEQTAGGQYRYKLENTIEASIPNPVINNKVYDPGFELYKTKLTNMFILENFDHGDDLVKLKYEIKIKDEVDKYFQEAQKRNAVPISKDEIYNELYSALFKVPIPNEASVLQEVEEVKLRCEIDGWFDGLPIREAPNLNELLDWDKILEMLTKRIYEIENNEPDAVDIIHKEITKWIIKFPLLPGEVNNVDKHAKSLEDRLILTKNERKCMPKSKLDKVAKKGKTLKKNPVKNTNLTLDKSLAVGPTDFSPQLGISPIPETSIWAANQTETSPNPYCVAASTPKRKPADIILEIVENWCQSLPLYSEPGEKEDIGTVKDNLMTKILRKLSELNANPEIFGDDFLYDEYLDDELDRLIKTLPMCCELQLSIEARKYQLISALRTVKPLLRAERARHDYKMEIRNTIRTMLKGPMETSTEKAVFDDIVDDVADSFIQYNYNKDDYEGRQVYKNQVRDAIITYYTELKEKSSEDLLIKQNKLLCELAKIPIPSEAAIKETVEEIKMKNEVSDFIEEVIPDENVDLKKQIKSNLSKRLHDLEKSGHTYETDKTMKEEIARSLKKVHTEVNMETIENFVSKLRNSETIRKSPPIRTQDGLSRSMNVSQQLEQHGWHSGNVSENSIEQNYEYQPPTQNYSTSCGQSNQYQPSESIKYHTIPPDNTISPENIIPEQSGKPKNLQWYQPEATTDGSKEWHTLPPQSPQISNQPPAMLSKSNATSNPVPSPSPVRNNVTQGSRSRPSPNTKSAKRFLPRQQEKRQTVNIPRAPKSIARKRDASLQSRLKSDCDGCDNKPFRTTPNSYKELCSKTPKPPENDIRNAPLNVLVFDDGPTCSEIGCQPEAPKEQCTNTGGPTNFPGQQSNLSTRSYQGCHNAVDAVPSLAQIPIPADAIVPISAVPQSTRNQRSLIAADDEFGPALSNVSQGSPQDVPPASGTCRMAAGLRGMNPPRKRRRMASPDEEDRENCDCLERVGRKRRCMPLPEDWDNFPCWCFMPYGFCYF